MSRLAILAADEQKKFNSPPKLSKTKDISSIVDEARPLVERIYDESNLILYILQFIYFKLSGKFFDIASFRKKDIELICRIEGININKVDLNNYKKRTVQNHQKKILDFLGWKRLKNLELKLLKNEIDWHVKQQLHPREVFEISLKFMFEQKIEIPAYYNLADYITESYLDVENRLVKIVDKSLKKYHKKVLDDFIRSKDKKISGIAYIKSLNQSTKPKDIADSIKTFKMMKAYYVEFKHILLDLDLSRNAIKYYAGWVKRSKLFQLKQFSNRSKAYLYLIAYLAHEYYIRHDGLLVIFMKQMRTILNDIEKEIEEKKKTNNKIYKNIIQKFSAVTTNKSDTIAKIKGITKDESLSDSEKILFISKIISESEVGSDVFTDIESEKLEEINSKSKSDTFYDLLRKSSVKMQRRLTEVVKVFDFCFRHTDHETYLAIDNFCTDDGNVSSCASIGFLSKNEQKKVTKDQKGFDVTLYKALLFKHIYDNIKAGKINLNNSYEYLPVERYLIDERAWRENKQHILASCNLERFSDFKNVIDKLSTRLNDMYDMVNQEYLSSENQYLKFDNKGVFRVRTPKIKRPEQEKFVPKLLHEDGIHSILDVFSQINQITSFSGSFKHHSNKHVKMKPSQEMIYAGLLGRGCNIGVSKIANISKGITEWSLKNTVNWFFGLNNLNEANNKVISKINSLALPKVFRSNDMAHTSSDGQKMKLSVDSLHANYSFKYYGKDQGIAIYSFIDDRHVLFHNVVISPSEREAAYVIDGLIGNKLIKSDIHSTDTHGYTEIIFGLTHLLDKSFAPRIKKIGKQSIYSFKTKRSYVKKGYKVLPDSKIKTKLIQDNWDLIMRFVASLLKKTTTASQVLKRLGSHKKDSPLHKALKEFGRIIKSVFILTYINDVNLRQKVEKQLNKIELANKFTKAVFFSNNQEFRDGTKHEQQITVACKTLIQNCIILWNYLFITKHLISLSHEDKKIIIEKVRAGSILCWKHINLLGEYDFTKQPSNDLYFKIDQLVKLKVA